MVLHVPPYLTLINSTFCAHDVCVLCAAQHKRRLFACTALSYWFYNRDNVCLLRGTC